MAEVVSYGVYLVVGTDLTGEEIWSDAVAHYREEANALAHKRRLEASGETAHVRPTILQDFSELGLEQWFSD